MAKQQNKVRERIVYHVVMAMIGLLRVFPHRARLRVVHGVMRAIGGISGQRRRIRENLALVRPDLDPDEARRIENGVLGTIGYVFAEVFVPGDLAKAARSASFTGPGVVPLQEAHAAGRPIIVASGHFGNYDAFRVALIQRGHDVGALYRPFNNSLFDARYKATLLANGGQLFPRGRSGIGDMVRHLRDGGTLGILHDQHMDKGTPLTFFGKTALTATTPAQLALKYDALLVPIYGLRTGDGTTFDLIAEAPIAHTDEETMMQQLNDSLEARVRGHMDQWIWTHRRWKPRKKRGKS